MQPTALLKRSESILVYGTYSYRSGKFSLQRYPPFTLPDAGKDPIAEHKAGRIPGAKFFDVERIAGVGSRELG